MREHTDRQFQEVREFQKANSAMERGVAHTRSLHSHTQGPATDIISVSVARSRIARRFLLIQLLTFETSHELAAMTAQIFFLPPIFLGGRTLSCTHLVWWQCSQDGSA